MRYQVPQFLEMESSLIGPLSLRQFLFIVIPSGIVYFLRFFLHLGYVIVLGIIIIPLGLLCAFYKINGRPFYYAMFSFVSFAVKPQIYVWRKELEHGQIGAFKEGEENQKEGARIARVEEKEAKKDKRGLDEVSWRVDVGEKG